MSEKLGIDVPANTGLPNEALTLQNVQKLYAAVMTSSAEKVSKEEQAVESEKKLEELRLKKLQEMPQEKILEKAIEQKMLEMKKSGSTLDPEKDKHISYVNRFTNMATSSTFAEVSVPEVDPASFYAVSGKNQKKKSFEGKGKASKGQRPRSTTFSGGG
eukprot:6558103-Karenia_brevis.AAC.1